MRKLLTLLLAVLFFSCQNSSTISLSGKVEGIDEETEMYLHIINENNQPVIVDTILVKDGQFSHKFQKSNIGELAYFSIKNVNGNVIFFPENKNISFTIYKDSLYSSTMKGGKTNALFVEFNKEIQRFSALKKENTEAIQEARKNQNSDAFVRLQTESAVIADRENVYKKEFVKKNNNSLLSFILMREMLMREEMTVNEVARVLEGVKPKLQKSFYYQSLAQTVEANRSAEVGEIAPDFSAPTPEGDLLALNDILGKVTLIDFWASWCGPCRRENPNVVRVYNQYKDKGLSIISVSLDRPGQKAQWLKAIEDDKMDWHHISNLQFWNDPIAKQYGVRGIPATFLLDENGKIIAKNLRGPALGQKIGELLD